ncbi:Crp/Fnr family transcriptional regulator [Methylobacterium oxalidis]|uniref:Crp/Fnr family transcriptional regulator n=1 Tax=Methylobacterium oxalidis TaxID=944322 RepID=UPI003315761B
MKSLPSSNPAPWSPSAAHNESSPHPFIRKLQRLALLSAADIAALARVSATPVFVGQNTDLVPEGQPVECAFLILEGFACRYRIRPGGARQILTYLLPGDLFGLDAPLVPRSPHALGTLSACQVVRIPHEVLLLLIEQHPQIALALHLSKLVEEAVLHERLVSLGSRSGIERMAHLFCELNVRLQMVSRAAADQFGLPLTQVDLGDTLGLSNVHVNRVLQDLRRQGLIALSGRVLTILNRPQLEALAEFNASYLHLASPTAGG